MTTPRLGVNIDHVATLRQARGEAYPSVVDAATICCQQGADQITIHLREDRRHIQDTDVETVRLVTKRFGRPLNLEMGCNREIIDVAKATHPDWVCLVPENRQERTTEGGLDLQNPEIYQKVYETCSELKNNIEDLKISLFLEAEGSIIEKALELKKLVDAVEVHTGDYARDFLNGNELSDYLKRYEVCRKELHNNQVGCHAGHGLTAESVTPLLENNLFEEYNIGHWIICQAVFDGLGNVVKSLRDSFDRAGR